MEKQRRACFRARNWCEMQDMVGAVAVDEAIVDYMLAIVERTRSHEGLALGVSPRGSQAFYRAVQAYALLEDRGLRLPDDVKAAGAKSVRTPRGAGRAAGDRQSTAPPGFRRRRASGSSKRF